MDLFVYPKLPCTLLQFWKPKSFEYKDSKICLVPIVSNKILSDHFTFLRFTKTLSYFKPRHIFGCKNNSFFLRVNTALSFYFGGNNIFSWYTSYYLTQCWWGHEMDISTWVNVTNSVGIRTRLSDFLFRVDIHTAHTSYISTAPYMHFWIPDPWRCRWTFLSIASFSFNIR